MLKQTMRKFAEIQFVYIVFKVRSILSSFITCFKAENEKDNASFKRGVPRIQKTNELFPQSIKIYISCNGNVLI